MNKQNNDITLMHNLKPKVSIVIPTYNGEQFLVQVLEAISTQSLTPSEVIIIDSSSTDKTLEIAKKYPVRIISIRKDEFGHGKTRNLGARQAKGDIVVYLTQDAIPRNLAWLGNLVNHISKNTVATFSKQIARGSARNAEKIFYKNMYPDCSSYVSNDNKDKFGVIFSNASSAILRSYILQNPFPENILMSEDYHWALDTLKNNKEIYYDAASQVTHSHDSSYLSIFKRYFDFGVSHQEIKSINKYMPTKSNYQIAINELAIAYRDGNNITRIKNVHDVLIFDLTKFAGLTMGKMHNFIPKNIKKYITTNYKEYWL